MRTPASWRPQASTGTADARSSAAPGGSRREFPLWPRGSRREFPLRPRGRGPRGVRMATGDKCRGMVGALEEVFPRPGARGALCTSAATSFPSVCGSLKSNTLARPF